MRIKKTKPNCNICTITELTVGDGFIKTIDNIEYCFMVIGINKGENFYRCISLENGKEYIFHNYEIVREITEINI